MKPGPEQIVTDLLAAADNYDVEGCDRLLAAAVSELETLILIRDVISPLLREAGNRWHRGELAVVQEHMISGVVRRQLTYALDRYVTHSTGPCILFATLSGERHELGALMGAVLAARQGIQALYLGPDLPVREISLFCAHRLMQVLALSVVTKPDVIDAETQITELRSAISPATEIWVAGPASKHLATSNLPADVYIIRDLEEFFAKLSSLKSRSIN